MTEARARYSFAQGYYPMSPEGLSAEERAAWFEAVGYRDRATLRELYEARGLPAGEIAARYGVAASTIRDWVKRHGLEQDDSRDPVWLAHRRRVLKRLGIDPDA